VAGFALWALPGLARAADFGFGEAAGRRGFFFASAFAGALAARAGGPDFLLGGFFVAF
jgi:hypothetical protein